jgi:hypothetical protein
VWRAAGLDLPPARFENELAIAVCRRPARGAVEQLVRADRRIDDLEKNMSRTPVRPFLIDKDETGEFRITIRETRYNSQHYPLVTSTLQPNSFKTVAAARAYAKANFGAVAGEFALQ